MTTAHAVATPHIMVIVEENEGYSAIVGSSAAPFINGTLLPHSKSATSWSGLTNISLADYVALISGTRNSYSAPTLVGELPSVGATWKSYFQSMPSACYTGGAAGNYTKTHNPFVQFPAITKSSQCKQEVVPFNASGFIADMNSTTPPDFVFVVPDDCNDMHSKCGGNPITKGDTWLKNNIFTSAFLSSSWYTAGGIVIVTWDYPPKGGSAHIPTFVYSASGTGQQMSNSGNHFGTLRAVAEAFGVTPPGASGDPSNGDLTPEF